MHLHIQHIQEVQAIPKRGRSDNVARITLEDRSACICEKTVKALRSKIRSREQLERAVLNADSGPAKGSPPCNNLNMPFCRCNNRANQKTERACNVAEGSDEMRFVVSSACGTTRVKNNLSGLGCGHGAEKVLLNVRGEGEDSLTAVRKGMQNSEEGAGEKP